MHATVIGLFRYPVKGLAGTALSEAVLRPGHGIAGDRRFAVARGGGTLEPASPFSVALSNLPAFATGWIVVGADVLGLPIAGGVVVPTLDLLVPFTADQNGSLHLATTWPTGVPSGTTWYLQAWIFDSASPTGAAASNAVSLITP